MAKVVLIDHYKPYADMMANPLVQAGHAVVIVTPPLNFERIIQVQPDVVSVAIYRQKCAFDRPIRDLERDITGYDVLRQLENYPAINALPIILTAIGLLEEDIPTSLQYDVFLTLPDDLAIYSTRVEELQKKPKGRHRISGLVCPVCQSRLVSVRGESKELVCPRCDTVVVLEEGEKALYMPPSSPGESFQVAIAELRPPRPDAADFTNS